MPHSEFFGEMKSKMEITMKKMLAFVFLFIIIFLTGCLPKNKPETVYIPTYTLSPDLAPIQQNMIISTYTPVPKRTIVGPPTSVPTLTFNQEQTLIPEIQSGSCKLPCFLGIIPGVTKISEAEDILENLGASKYGLGPYTQKNLTYYTFMFSINDDDALIPNMFYISLATIDDNIVHRIHTNIACTIPEYFDNYSVKSIFEQLGMPDDILITIKNYDSNTFHNVLIIYGVPGVVAELSGKSDINYVCIGQKNVYGILLNIADPTIGLDMTRDFPSINNNWEPIENVIGISQEDFYAQIMKDGSACFMLLD